MNHTMSRWAGRIVMLLAAVLSQIAPVLAQDARTSSLPAGLAMLVLFLGIAGMVGVLVIRWSQTTREDEE